MSIEAGLSAKINALTSNLTTSLGAALENASSVAIGAILATNKTNTSAQAYVTGGSVTAGGDIAIGAADASTIDAIDNQVVASTLEDTGTSTNSVLSNYAAQVKQGEQFTNSRARKW